MCSAPFGIWLKMSWFVEVASDWADSFWLRFTIKLREKTEKCRRVFAPHKLQFIVASVAIENSLDCFFCAPIEGPVCHETRCSFSSIPFEILLLVAGWHWVVFIQCTREERPIYKHKHQFIRLSRLLLRCTSHHNGKDQSVVAMVAHMGRRSHRTESSSPRHICMAEWKQWIVTTSCRGQWNRMGKTSVYRFLHVITNWDLSLPRAISPNTQHLKWEVRRTTLAHAHATQSTMELYNNIEIRMNGNRSKYLMGEGISPLPTMGMQSTFFFRFEVVGHSFITNGIGRFRFDPFTDDFIHWPFWAVVAKYRLNVSRAKFMSEMWIVGRRTIKLRS